MNKEGEEDSLFVLAEAVDPAASDGGIGPPEVGGNNLTDGEETNDAPNLISGRTSNLRLEDMAELCRQGIAIDYDKNPAMENIPRHSETTSGTGNWRREGIICPRKAGIFQNSFASFRQYSHDAILCMSLLQFLLVMFPEDYLEEFLITKTNKGLIVPMDLQDFIKWVGCCLYMAC